MRKVNEKEARYQLVMRNLIKRYIMNKSRGKIDESVTGKCGHVLFNLRHGRKLVYL